MKQLIMERFDIFAAKRDRAKSSSEVPSAAPTSNGHNQTQESVSPAPSSSNASSSLPKKRDADSDLSSDRSTKAHAPKKHKKTASNVDADAIYAAKLQAEENKRVRSTRGGNTRKAAPVKKKAKTKTSKKVKAEDDSELESGSETTKKEVNRSGGFHVCFLVLSLLL